jgi:hypothetical protein
MSENVWSDTDALWHDAIMSVAAANAKHEGLTLEEYLADPPMRFQGNKDFFNGLVDVLTESGFLKDPDQAKANVASIFGRTHDREGNEISSQEIGFSCKRSQFEVGLNEIAKATPEKSLKAAKPLVFSDLVFELII